MNDRAVISASPVAAKARAVTHAPKAMLQRKCDCGGPAGLEGECAECKKKKLQRRATAPGPAAAPPIVHDVLRSPGQPLDEPTRLFFEPRFGHDFSQVRVHTDSRAAESARAVKAQAYAVGHHLVFAAGRFVPGTQSGQRLLAHELTHVVQQSQGGGASVQRKLEVGAVNDSLEQEADRFTEQITGDSCISAGWPVPPPSNGANKRVQRAPGNSASDPGAPAAATVPPGVGLIAEDESAEVGPSQLRKSEFLDGLRDSVCATADSELAASGRTAQGCPFIERWITKLRGRNSQYIERAIRKYAPRAASASAARDYFTAVGEQVRQGVRRWASTGDLSGVPPELMSEMGGGGILSAIGGAVSGVAGAIGGAVSGIGKLFAKAREGGAREANPAAVQAQLGSGATLDAGVRTRMESAFGHDFSSVRVHAGSRAAELSSRVNARAFTIGNAVAFGAGEYRPGTLIGDALIAHELAHVAQQSGGLAGPLSDGGAQYNALEEDADQSAVGAMVSLWTGTKATFKNLGATAGPRLRSGLRLQRCGGPDRKLDISTWTAQQKKDFIRKNFAEKDRSFAGKILQDMLDSNELKFIDEQSLKDEIAKRMDTVKLLRKTQEPYGVAFDYPENGPQCFPKGSQQGRVNKAAQAYWGPAQFSDTGHYYFDLTEQGKNNAYLALTSLFTPQSNICDKTLIHCDYLASVIHFRAFADQIGVEEFNRRVKNGDIEMRLASHGFQDLEDVGWFHSKKSISIREVRPKTENDLVIGDQVLFFNHRAYDLINERVYHEWRLENAFLIYRKNNVDSFEGHGSGIKTNHEMLVKLASKYNEIVKDATEVIKGTKSKNAKIAASANAEMATSYPKIKLVNGKWNIVGTSWGKNFNEELRYLDAVHPEKETDLTGLHDPKDPTRLGCIKRPSEAPGDSC